MNERKLSLTEIFSYIESQSFLVKNPPARYQMTIEQWLRCKYALTQMENGNVPKGSNPAAKAGPQQLPAPVAVGAPPIQDALAGAVPASGSTVQGAPEGDAGEEEEVTGILPDPDSIPNSRKVEPVFSPVG